MKKFLTLLLSLSLILSMSLTAFAAESKRIRNTGESTLDIKYNASENGGSDSADWTVTVPATLVPGETGTVTAKGFWAPYDTLSVTADTSVNLYLEDSSNGDYAEVPVSCNGISLVGSYTEIREGETTVIVDAENTLRAIKFGTWTGNFNFYINIETDPDYESGNIDGGTTAPEEPNPDDVVTIRSVDDFTNFLSSNATRAVLAANIVIDDPIVITRSITLDLGSYTITGNSDDSVVRAYSSEADTVIDVTITATTGGGIINNGTGYAIYAGEDIADGNDEERTNLTINGGTYSTNGTDCVCQILGTCTINGGSYRSSYSRTVLNGERWYGSEFVINDGTFYGFNPACVSVWTGFNGNDYTNFYHQHDIIASGKTVVYSNGWYTVVDGTFVPKASTKALCFISVEVAIQEIVAMNDVANLGTITLLADDELTADAAALAINNNFSFVLGSYTLTLPEGYTTYKTTSSGQTVTKIKRDVVE